jgi:fatty acid desaturase
MSGQAKLVTLHPLAHYAKEVRPQLPAHAFEAVPSRLAWLTLHVALIALGITAIARGWGGWWAAPLWSLLIGHSFAGCAFVGHETLHGAVVRNATLRQVIGWVCFLPFTLSPRLWVEWHNRTHHGHTMEDGVDPDAYPTLAQYRASGVTRFADRLSYARDRWLGVIVTLLIGFTGQSQQMLWRWSRDPRCIFETLLGFAFWTLVAIKIGGVAFLFAFVLPLMVGNMIVIGYILTNHSLNPMTELNDPLANTLSVEVPGWVSRLHLHFGLHVEHHLFPSMSSAHAPLVRDALKSRWPERYQSMPLFRALGLLLKTPRVYRSPTRLVDPLTGVEADTLPVITPVKTPAATADASPDKSADSSGSLPGSAPAAPSL